MDILLDSEVYYDNVGIPGNYYDPFRFNPWYNMASIGDINEGNNNFSSVVTQPLHAMTPDQKPAVNNPVGGNNSPGNGVNDFLNYNKPEPPDRGSPVDVPDGPRSLNTPGSPNRPPNRSHKVAQSQNAPASASQPPLKSQTASKVVDPNGAIQTKPIPTISLNSTVSSTNAQVTTTKTSQGTTKTIISEKSTSGKSGSRSTDVSQKSKMSFPPRKTTIPMATLMSVNPKFTTHFRTPSLPRNFTNSSMLPPGQTTPSTGASSIPSLVLYTVPPLCLILAIVLAIALVIYCCRKKANQAKAEQEGNLWMKSRGEVTSMTNSGIDVEEGDVTPEYPSTDIHDDMQCEVIRGFEPRTDKHLQLMVGDDVRILERSDDGWVRGENVGGTGWFPEACVRPLRSEVTIESMSDDVFCDPQDTKTLPIDEPTEYSVSTFKLKRQSDFNKLNKITGNGIHAHSKKQNGHINNKSKIDFAGKGPVLYDMTQKNDSDTDLREKFTSQTKPQRKSILDKTTSNETDNNTKHLDKHTTLENLADMIADKNVDLFSLSHDMVEAEGIYVGNDTIQLHNETTDISTENDTTLRNDTDSELLTDFRDIDTTLQLSDGLSSPIVKELKTKSQHNEDNKNHDIINNEHVNSRLKNNNDVRNNNDVDITNMNAADIQSDTTSDSGIPGIQGYNQTDHMANALPTQLQYRAFSPYTALSEYEISLAKGDVLSVIPGDGDFHWLRGVNEATGQSGWFPKNYVEQVNESSPPSPNHDGPSSAKQTAAYRAIYPYIGQYPEDLSFITDETINVTQCLDNGWWHGTKGYDSGWFPGSYVTPLDVAQARAGSPIPSISSINSTESGDSRLRKTSDTKHTPRSVKRHSRARRPSEPAPSPPTDHNSSMRRRPSQPAPSPPRDNNSIRRRPSESAPSPPTSNNSLRRRRPSEPAPSPPSNRSSSASVEETTDATDKNIDSDGSRKYKSPVGPPVLPKRYSKPRFSKRKSKLSDSDSAPTPTSRPPPPRPPSKDNEVLNRKGSIGSKLTKSDISGPIKLDHSTYNRIHLHRTPSSPPDQIRTLQYDFDKSVTHSPDVNLGYSNSFHGSKPPMSVVPSSVLAHAHSFHSTELKHRPFFPPQSVTPFTSSPYSPSLSSSSYATPSFSKPSTPNSASASTPKSAFAYPSNPNYLTQSTPNSTPSNQIHRQPSQNSNNNAIKLPENRENPRLYENRENFHLYENDNPYKNHRTNNNDISAEPGVTENLEHSRLSEKPKRKTPPPILPKSKHLRRKNSGASKTSDNSDQIPPHSNPVIPTDDLPQSDIHLRQPQSNDINHNLPSSSGRTNFDKTSKPLSITIPSRNLPETETTQRYSAKDIHRAYTKPRIPTPDYSIDERDNYYQNEQVTSRGNTTPSRENEPQIPNDTLSPFTQGDYLDSRHGVLTNESQYSQLEASLPPDTSIGHPSYMKTDVNASPSSPTRPTAPPPQTPTEPRPQPPVKPPRPSSLPPEPPRPIHVVATSMHDPDSSQSLHYSQHSPPVPTTLYFDTNMESSIV